VAPFAAATSVTSGLHLTVRRALAVGALGVFGTGVAYILNYRLLREIGATRASVVTYIIPVVAVTVGVVVLGEPFEWRLVWGGVLILAGLVLLRERRTIRLPVPSAAVVLLVVMLLAAPLAACGGGGSSAACSIASSPSSAWSSCSTSRRRWARRPSASSARPMGAAALRPAAGRVAASA